MNKQLSFFDDEFEADLAAKSLHRRNDPATSHEAADGIQPAIGKLHLRFLATLRAMGSATAQEVACGNESVRKRAGELLKRRLIEVAGTRCCKVTGKNAQTYAIATKQGSE